jgi:two-component system, OmpR family, sensor kinase
MRRRLLVAIVGAVAAALVLAGLGTLLLAGIGARRYAEGELRQQVTAVGESLSTDEQVWSGQPPRPRVLGTVRDALRLEGVSFLVLADDGQVLGTPPPGVTLTATDLAGLREGETVSGRQGRLVYAAAPIQRGSLRAVLILSDRSAIALGGSVLWFLLAAAAVLALAAVVAGRLARALSQPLRGVEDASRRIAGGDLATRVPEPPAGATDEVAELSRSINAMAGALERSRTLDQQFLLSVSHDLRTPLSSIQGYAEALADGTIDDATRAGTVILSESRRLDRLVRDLLQLARLDARSFSLDRSPVELHELVAACVEGFGPEAEAAGVSIELHVDPAMVVGDADRLAQVVANLLENALRFAAQRVIVTVEVAGGRARVTVADDGVGIDPADRSLVFERLYLARDHRARKEGGSGLGLAIVRELVTAMGGTVGADGGDQPNDVGDGGDVGDPSRPRGALLWFELPEGA